MFTATHESAIRRLAIVSLFFLFPAIKILDPVIWDPDIWWHLRTGQWILENGSIPVTDPFSQYGMGKPWEAYSWLFEVVIYGLYRSMGFCGILFYELGMAFAIVLSLHRLILKREPRFVAGSGVICLTLFSLFPVLSPRPWLFTILFFIWTLDVVMDMVDGGQPKPMWRLPVLFAIWANLHIQFVYGLFILGLACIAPYVNRLLDRSNFRDSPATPTNTGRMILLTASCAAAALLNPYHVHIYDVVFWYATNTAQYGYVTEMLAPRFRDPSAWTMLALAGIAVAVLSRRHGPAFPVMLLVVAAGCSFRSLRDVWFLSIASAAVIAAARRNAEPRDRFDLTARRCLIVAFAVGIVILGVWRYRGITESRIVARTAEIFPDAAVRIVRERGYPGPLYNHFNWGGYLIWSLPELPVSLDGRVPVHGDERCMRSIAVWSGKPDWASDTELAAARVVIGKKDRPLMSLLKLDPRYEMVYEDTLARVFVARSTDAQAGSAPPAPQVPAAPAPAAR